MSLGNLVSAWVEGGGGMGMGDVGGWRRLSGPWERKQENGEDGEEGGGGKGGAVWGVELVGEYQQLGVL